MTTARSIVPSTAATQALKTFCATNDKTTNYTKQTWSLFPGIFPATAIICLDLVGEFIVMTTESVKRKSGTLRLIKNDNSSGGRLIVDGRW